MDFENELGVSKSLYFILGKHDVSSTSIACVIFGVALIFGDVSNSCFEIKHCCTMKNAVKNASSVPENARAPAIYPAMC